MNDEQQGLEQIPRSDFMRDPAAALRRAEAKGHLQIRDSNGRVSAVLSAPAAPVFDLVDLEED